MSESREIRWQPETSALAVILSIGSDHAVRLKSVLPKDSKPNNTRCNLCEDSSLPLSEIRIAGEATDDTKSSKSLICGRVSFRLKYENHIEKSDSHQHSLEITSRDEATNLSVTAHLVTYPGIPVLRSWTTVTNDGQSDIILTQVSSLVLGGLTNGVRDWWKDYVASSATNTWFREAQWHDHSLPSIGLDSLGVLELNQGHVGTHATWSVVNQGNFSSGGHLPMGMIKAKTGDNTWLWQVENNGSWRWEIGDYKDDIYVAINGPEDYDHHWKECLKPGQSFQSVPCAIVHVNDGIDAAFGALTNYRRRIRRPHRDNEDLPVIFNDYMNCLMGNPDDEKVAALIDPAASVGSEYFVIDAGWFAPKDGDWWDGVGEWKESAERFPNGLKSTLNAIRAKNMIPGIWVEPEVVGIRSPIADQLPPECFFQENGKRIIDKARHQLDYRHPAVIKRMDAIIDDLVINYGVGYFKFDYNVDVVHGTDVDAFSTGSAALAHNRAYLKWIKDLLDRHEGLVIENCSSGGQRLDYALLSIKSVQSTSDQQDYLRYAAVSAAIPTAVAPEQSASWAYPQPDWTDEMIAFTVVNTLLGRVHISGRLDLLNEKQLGLVSQGMRVYKSIRKDIKDSVPFWPLGLPDWHDDWLCLGLKTKSGAYIGVWRRGGETSCSLPIASSVTEGSVEVLYPTGTGFETDVSLDSGTRQLKMRLAAVNCARLLKLG
jgi:alpha-galactosidase